MEPVRAWLPDINKIIKDNNIKPVTSLMIKEPSTNLFHPMGLYSEQIFGRVASPERLVTMGCIPLRTKVFHPNVFQNLIRLNRLFGEVMSGASPAVFDEVKKTLVRPQYVDKNNPHPVGTGYAFFMKYFPMIVFEKNASLTRSDRINILEKYKHQLLIDHFLVLPAGLRDIRLEEDRPQVEEINEFYVKLLSYTQTLPQGMSTEEDMWDNIRWYIQKTIGDIHTYISNIVSGGKGMMEAKHAARSIAYGTRNVLSGATTGALTFDDPKRHKTTETFVPLFQCMKAFLPFVLYHMKTAFFYGIFEEGSDTIYATQAVPEGKSRKKEDFQFVAVNITSKIKNQFLSADGMEKLIENFRATDVRKDPVGLIMGGQSYWLYLVYEEGDRIWLFRNFAEFCTYYEETAGKEPDPDKVRPLTYCELFYMATYMGTYDKHVSVTRYPVLGPNSIYPSKCILSTTVPDRTVHYTNVLNNSSFTFHHYPDLAATFMDGVRVHPIWLPNLGGDYDGDTVNVIGIWSKKANEECAAHINSYSYLLAPSGNLILPPVSDPINIALHSLSRPKRKNEVKVESEVKMEGDLDLAFLQREIDKDLLGLAFL